MRDFALLFDPSVHDAINESCARYPDREAVVCFENLDMNSHAYGSRTACVVGPSNTWKLEDVLAGNTRLGHSPSRFQYPVCYVRFPAR